MADLITTARAQSHLTLAAMSATRLAELITAASVMINAKYTVPSPVTEDIQEACVLFMVYLSEDFGAGNERLGDWSKSGVGAPRIPAIITKMLYPYKTPGLSPVVVEGSLDPDDDS